MKKIYYIEREHSRGDLFGGAYEKAEDAILAAEAEWRHLTQAEQRSCRSLTVFYGSCPEELELPEAMDYILDEDTGGYELLSFSLAAPIEVTVNSPEAAADIESIIPPITLADGRVFTVSKVKED